MPPRFAYWTIIVDGGATSFRARDREDLEPTLKQLRKKDPGAVLRWFSGGKLWDSPEDASASRARERVEQEDATWRAAIDALRQQRAAQVAVDGEMTSDPADDRAAKVASETAAPPPPAASRDSAGPRPVEEPRSRDRRGKDWRPGGEHRDPRDKYKGEPGARRAQWKARTFGKKPGGGFWKPKPKSGDGEQRHDRQDPRSRSDRPAADRPATDRPWANRPRSDRPPTDRPRSDRPQKDWARSDRPPTDRPRSDRPQKDWARSDRPPTDRPRSDRPQKDWARSDRPPTDRPRSDRPPTDRPWTDRARAERPRFDRPKDDRSRTNKPGGGPPRDSGTSKKPGSGQAGRPFGRRR